MRDLFKRNERGQRQYTALCFPNFILLIALLLCGCHPLSPASSAIPVLNIVAIDRSGSTEPQRSKQKEFLGDAFNEARLRSESFAIWVVDQNAAPIAIAKSYSVEDTLDPKIEKEIETPAKGRSIGTRPAKFWAAMVDRYAHGGNSEKASIRIAFLTDGGNDWAGEDSLIVTDVKRLSENPNVTIALVGLDPDEAKKLEPEFAPFTPDRIVLRIAGQEKGAVDDWRKLGH